MIRFTETAKWRDPWFQQLSHGSKLLFIYLIENCDNAGFYEINEAELCFHLGITMAQYKGALKGLQRGIEGPNIGWLRIKNFLKHQKNSELNPANPAHKQIIAILRSQSGRFPSIKDLLPKAGPKKGLRSPIGTGTGTGTGQSTEEGGNGGKKQKPDPLYPTDPQAVQLAACVGRQASTAWNEPELNLWRKLKRPLDQPQLDRVSLYYAKNRKRENNYCRRDLKTLLGNYAGECDRANSWCEKFRKGRIMRTIKTAAVSGEPLPTHDPETFARNLQAWKDAGRPFDRVSEFFPAEAENQTNGEKQHDTKKQ